MVHAGYITQSAAQLSVPSPLTVARSCRSYLVSPCIRNRTPSMLAHSARGVTRSRVLTNFTRDFGRKSTSLAVCPPGSGALALRKLVVAASASVDVETGHFKLEREGYFFLDVRSEREYDNEHITKPPRKTFNVPMDQPNYIGRVGKQFPNKGALLLVACADGGAVSQDAVSQLVAAGYGNIKLVEGGWAAWRAVFSTSGRRKPPPGKWVHTGKEALKSGLTVGAASTYEEGGSKDGTRLQP